MNTLKHKLVLGTVQFGLNYGINNVGGKPSEFAVHEILDHAAQQGIFLLDTANAYGNAQELLGNYQLNHGAPFQINSKFKLDGYGIDEQLNATLKSLQTDGLNAYFYHSFKDMLRSQNGLPELQKLKANGRIKEIGVSVYENEEFKTAIEQEAIDLIQLPFNLLDNRAQRGGLLRAAKEHGKRIQVRSVFLQGLFFKSTDHFPSKLAPLIEPVNQLSELSKTYGLSMAALALGYALAQPEIDEVIIGVDSLAQLKNNIDMASQPLPVEVQKAIDHLQVADIALLYPKNW